MYLEQSLGLEAEVEAFGSSSSCSYLDSAVDLELEPGSFDRLEDGLD